MMLLRGYTCRCVLIQALSLYFVQLQVESQQFHPCTDPSLENGKAITKQGAKGVFFRCNKGFQRRLGAKFALCLEDGSWSKPPPKCIRKGCRAIHSNKNLRVKRKYRGAVLKFTCAAGMQRQGPEFIYCNGKRWNVEIPPKCVVDIDLQCGFEDVNLCGWSQADNDQFEWTWFSGGTLSPDTGPQTDHTFGSSDSGHFLYIEASHRKPNDTAILLSPLYSPQYSSLCFEFWYHMYGPDNAVGSLEVFVKPESRKLYDLYPEFNENGNQGPEWKRASIKIQHQTEVFQIVIVGTLKGKFKSDIAVDDFKLHNCTKDDPGDLELNGVPETNTAESVIISQTGLKDTESGINPRNKSYSGLTEDSETTVALPTMAVHHFSTAIVSSAMPQQAVNSIRTSNDATIALASQTSSVMTQDIKPPTQTVDPPIIEESAPYLSLLIRGTTEFLTSEVSNTWNVRETIHPAMTRHPLQRGFSTSEHLQSQQYSHTSNTLTSSSAIAFSVSPSLSTTTQSINLSTQYQRTDDLATIEEESLPLRISTTEFLTSSKGNKVIAPETFKPTRLMKTFNTIETSFQIFENAYMTQTARSVEDDLTSSSAIAFSVSPSLSTTTQSINLSTKYQRTDDLATLEEESLPLRISTTEFLTSSIENKVIAPETFKPTRLMKTFNTIETSFQIFENAYMTQTARSVEDDLTSSSAIAFSVSPSLSTTTQSINLSTKYQRTDDLATLEEESLPLRISTTEFLTSSIENKVIAPETFKPTRLMKTFNTIETSFQIFENAYMTQTARSVEDDLTSSSAIAFSVSPSFSTTTTDGLATIEEEYLPLRISTTKFLTSSIENKVIAPETFKPTRLMKTFNTIETSFQIFENAYMTQTARSVEDDLTTDPPKRQTGIIYKATPLSTNTASIIFHIPPSSYANSIPQTVQASRPETDMEPFETIMPTYTPRTNLQPKHSTHSFSSKLAISASLPERPHEAASYSDLPINNSIGEGGALHELEYGLSSTIGRLNTELVNKSGEFYNPEMRETISTATLSIHFIIILSCCIVLGLIIIAIAAYVWAKREEVLMLKYRCADNQLQS